MTKRIAALSFIFACTTIAWFILGGTIYSRTDSLDSKLRGRVASTWGAPQEQQPPTATWQYTSSRIVEATERGKTVSRVVEDAHAGALPLDATRADVTLHLNYRQKGLLWFSTYEVFFDAAYTFDNDTDRAQDVLFRLKLPAAQALYDDFQFSLDGRILPLTFSENAAQARASLQPGQAAILRVHYRSQGLESWRYSFGADVAEVRDFRLNMHTDFRDIDFPENSLSPTAKRPTASGWDLDWTYKNLLAGYSIAMPMPEKLQPGPLAGQISFFAPVSLFFFFFLMLTITTIRGIDLHPMNYFFLACAFFAFHLLLAYLVDHISIHVAFLVCSGVSIFLVVTYLRLVTGLRFALVEAALAQFIYLVLFSYAFFFKGFTGLAVTIGAIVTLFVVMQITGRIRWSEKFSPAPPAASRV